ncbi:MAG: EFR1 family ferrodoxin [Phocaeicola sp.]|uniref:EFR1 family ferrodoxin n=1 Tax=Phocaeicola sp. TaxID=2773926 RepID=UPI003FA119A0
MIFYFSGTGNTRWAAEQIAAATGEELINIAANLQSNNEFHLKDDERIGFCFPIHGWRPPFIVREFVKQLHIKNADGHFCFGFATCGDDVGLTFDYLKEDLESAGLHLNSAFSIIMPESYIFPIIDSIDKPEVAEKKKKNGKKALETILPDIINRKSGIRKVNESHWPRLNSKVIGSFFLKKWVSDKPFHVDPKLCIRCGVCAMVCPVKNIKGGSGLSPEWLHNGLCTTCFSCYHHCPKHAIEFGNRTKGKRQYFFKQTNSSKKQN